jgi:hypothetical protein
MQLKFEAAVDTRHRNEPNYAGAEDERYHDDNLWG